MQVGARNMQNFTAPGDWPVTETGSSEARSGYHSGGMADGCQYIISGSNSNVVLCERGFEHMKREPIIPRLSGPSGQAYSHLPIIVDPSRNRRWRYVNPTTSIAAGADGLMISSLPARGSLRWPPVAET